MRKIIILLSLIASCTQLEIKKNEPVVEIKKIENPIVETVKKIGFDCKTCKSKELIKIKKAEVKANEIVQSKCFKDFMINWGLIWTNNKTAPQVVVHIQNANLTVPVHYYYGNCNIVGYRQPPKPDIYFNRCSHDQYKDTPWGICQTASNAVHEWSHALGYDHSFNKTYNRGKTVPYAINQAFNKCCN